MPNGKVCQNRKSGHCIVLESRGTFAQICVRVCPCRRRFSNMGRRRVGVTLALHALQSGGAFAVTNIFMYVYVSYTLTS